MAIQATFIGNICTIILEEYFDYTCREAFLKIYKDQPKEREYIIDFNTVRYMDSSALGALLILRQQNGGDGSKIHLINYNSDMKNILEEVKFTTLFNMDSQKVKTPDKLEQEEKELEKTFQDLLKRRKHL